MITSDKCWLKENCKQQHCNDECGCMILFKLDYLYNQAGIPYNQRAKMELRLDADNTDFFEFSTLKSIQDNIQAFVSGGQQLLIHSTNCGCGKTSWAIRLMQSFFNSIWLKTPLKCRGLFINVPTLLLALKDNITNKNEYIQHIRENIAECDLVIWDDIGSKSSTAFEAENLLSMIDRRINSNKANIFTSNLKDNELKDTLGERLASRICNLGYNIELHGGDKRGIQ